MYGDINFGGTIIFLLFGGAVMATAVWGSIGLFSDDSIKSKTRIEPQIELIIENNKVDTLFVYRLK